MSSHTPDTRTKILQATRQLMEDRRGLGVRMSDIAKAAGVSRQAVYLHFDSRIDLLSATTKYMDEINGLDGRLKAVSSAKSAVDMLDAYIDVWGNYLPEIHGLAGALFSVRETDDAAEMAWEECMSCHRAGCADIVSALKSEGNLADGWTDSAAADLLSTILSFQTWEQLTSECGWPTSQYIEAMKATLHRTLVKTG